MTKYDGEIPGLHDFAADVEKTSQALVGYRAQRFSFLAQCQARLLEQAVGIAWMMDKAAHYYSGEELLVHEMLGDLARLERRLARWRETEGA